MQCGIRLPWVHARIPAEWGMQSQPVQLSVQCGVVTSAGYELALGGSQTRNISLPILLHTNRSKPVRKIHLILTKRLMMDPIRTFNKFFIYLLFQGETGWCNSATKKQINRMNGQFKKRNYDLDMDMHHDKEDCF